jgi:multicomponent Na+:H+ antiporter subunit E
VIERAGFNIALAVVWCLLAGSFTAWNLVAGLAVSVLVISIYSGATGGPRYAVRLLNVLRFLAWFLGVLVKSNIQIAAEVVTPGWSQKPRVVRYDVSDLTAAQKTVLASAITLTPGTLTVDVCPNGDWLYLHCMYAEDRAWQIEQIDELAVRLKRCVFA